MSEAKNRVLFLLYGAYGKVSVRKGRGTAHSWLYITTERPVEPEVRALIEKHLVGSGLCGTYLADGCTERDANVNWFTEAD